MTGAEKEARMLSLRKSRIYLNPNIDARYYYPFLKTLPGLYDEVVVWSPSLRHLEEGGFKGSEFLEACEFDEGGVSPIVPAARETWFDRVSRLKHPDRNRREYSPAFDGAIERAARRKGAILKTTDMTRSHGVVRKLFVDPVLAPRAEALATMAKKAIEKNAPTHLEYLDAYRADHGWPLEWEIASAYLVDRQAAESLGVRRLVVRPSLLPAYEIMQDPADEGESARDDGGLGESAQPPRVRKADFPLDELDEFVKGFIGKRNPSWADIAQCRKKGLGQWFREWIADGMGHVPTPAHTLAEHAQGIAHELYKEARSALEKTSVTGGTVLALGADFLLGCEGVIPPTVAGALGGLAGVSLLHLRGVRSNLIPWVASMMEFGSARFLIDSAYFRCPRGREVSM